MDKPRIDTQEEDIQDGTREKWLVMIYLSGDNDLSEETVWSLLEVLRAEPNDQVRVVVQIDPRFQGIRRFDVNRLLKERVSERAKQARSQAEAPIEGAHNEILSRGQHIRTGDRMASISTLKKFIIESRSGPHKAKHELLVLSGHSGDPTGTSFLVDQFPGKGNGLSMKQVTAAIEEASKETHGRNIDVVGMDSCGMGMAEVGDQLAGCALHLVASEGFEMNTGWPYFHILEALNNNPGMSPRTLAAEIVKIHTDYYENYLMAGVSTDMAACDLEKAPDLIEAIKTLGQELTRNLLLQQKFSHKNVTARDKPRDKRIFVEDLPLAERAIADAIVMAHWRAQSYRFERHTDLYDFCDLLQRGCQDDAVVNACKGLKAAIKGNKMDDGTYEGYVIRCCHSGGSFQHSHGVAVLFPWAAVDESYSDLGLSQKTGWNYFLNAYVRTTRRRAREDSGVVQLAARANNDLLEMKDFPELSTKDFPELGTKDFPELSTKNFPELGTKDFPELGTKDFPELGTKGKGLVPAMKNPPNIFFSDRCKDED